MPPRIGGPTVVGLVFWAILAAPVIRPFARAGPSPVRPMSTYFARRVGWRLRMDSCLHFVPASPRPKVAFPRRGRDRHRLIGLRDESMPTCDGVRVREALTEFLSLPPLRC